MRNSPHTALARASAALTTSLLAPLLLTQVANAQTAPPAGQPVPPPPTAAPPSADAPTGESPGPAPEATPDASSPSAPAEAEPLPPAPEPEPALPEPSPSPYDDEPTADEAPAEASATTGPAVPAKADASDTEGFFAEDWWAHTRPAVELHGNFRVRSELYHQFSLGRMDSPGTAYWPRPLDDSYTDIGGGNHGASACTQLEAGEGNSSDPGQATYGCSNPTQAGANMRFRIEPAIIISDNLRIRSQIDLFDNLVMGSTAQGNVNFPAASGYSVSARGGYYPVSASSWSQGAAVTGLNTIQDGIAVKRAWAEYETPVGQARFGRMPDHWGLGLLHNAGDDLDGDYQSTVDRIAFFTGLESLSLYAGGAWDFPYEGPTSAAFTAPGGQPYDLAQFDDVSAMNLLLFRKVNPQLEQRILSNGGVVINGGLYLTFAFQRIANDYSGSGATCENGAATIDCQPGEAARGYTRRGFEQWTPDLYAEVKYKKFYAGAELVTHQGRFESTQTSPGDNDYDNTTGDDGWKINQWGFALKLQQLFLEDRLKLGFDTGWASGDNDVEGLVPPLGAAEQQIGDRTFETFRFHPGYRVDLILNRNILSRVQGSYYFKPSVQYDFIRKATGMRLGGRAEAIWTRASQFMQAPGHEHDLGIELNGTIFYQSKDGALNDSPNLAGGFYGMLQYGVLFPFSGLGYQDAQTPDGYQGLQTAQMVRMFLGVAY